MICILLFNATVDTETIASGDLTIPLPHGALAQAETHWQQKLEAAQNVLFCKELFSQVCYFILPYSCYLGLVM